VAMPGGSGGISSLFSSFGAGSSGWSRLIDLFFQLVRMIDILASLCPEMR
jgi:hypothetical protein